MKLWIPKIRLEQIDINRFDNAFVVKRDNWIDDIRSLLCAVCRIKIVDDFFICGRKDNHEFAVHSDCADDITLFMCDINESKKAAMNLRLSEYSKGIKDDSK